VLIASPSFAADTANQEIDTASKHAQMSADSTDQATAVKHLHHVVNCLVGPDGKGFDADEENPCKGMGNGALNDIQDGAVKAKLEKARKEAWKGIKASKFSTTTHAAKITEKILQSALAVEATGQ
jgi:hypothetical protein